MRGLLHRMSYRTNWWLDTAASLSLVFFFFQAEDGIRDTSVTGVQTCALPILRAPARGGCAARRRRSRRSPHPVARTPLSQVAPCRASRRPSRCARPRGCGRARSEERRVGKEWRYGGSPEHEQEREETNVSDSE